MAPDFYFLHTAVQYFLLITFSHDVGQQDLFIITVFVYLSTAKLSLLSEVH